MSRGESNRYHLSKKNKKKVKKTLDKHHRVCYNEYTKGEGRQKPKGKTHVSRIRPFP